jgi:uncharacterized membrane protein YhaH (DUF805 family)
MILKSNIIEFILVGAVLYLRVIGEVISCMCLIVFILFYEILKEKKYGTKSSDK